jgi:hypothetical protein
MSDIWATLLATAPLQTFLTWTAWLLGLDSLDQRRTARAAATAVRKSAPQPEPRRQHRAPVTHQAEGRD